jgi:uncharacterized membrane protein
METFQDAHLRSIIKALSWRAFGTIATILIVFTFTRRIVISLGVGAVELITKLVLYYLHERIWALIPFWKKIKK